MLGVPFFLGLKLWPGIEGAWKRHEAYTREKSEKRMSAETGRKDLMRFVASVSVSQDISFGSWRVGWAIEQLNSWNVDVVGRLEADLNV